jgi:cholesterol transport system auxiliary component
MNRLLMIWPLLLIMLFGCAGRARQAEVAQYDLGVIAPAAANPVAALRSINVKSPLWLDTTAMQYRLVQAQPAQRRAYAESRWVAPPGLLVEHALRQSLLGAAARTGECALQIDLDEFIQTFADEKSSQAEIRLRSTLLPQRGGGALATGNFAAAQTAGQADAVAGVAAHGRAVAELTSQLRSWLKQLGDDPRQPLAACVSGKS